MRALHFSILAVIVAAPSAAFAAHAAKHVAHDYSGITVPMDEARVITFQQPVATIFVGNTTIADVTVIDSRHAYLLGKAFGATNIIGLDADRKEVMNTQISVTNRKMGSVTVNRGAETYNYTCTPLHCETNPRPGDPATWGANTEGPALAHEDAGSKASVVAMGEQPH